MVRDLHAWTDSITYILPVTDNGGSTKEIMRVLGGPAIGDIRSRLIRLSKVAAELDGSEEDMAVVTLLETRLPRNAEMAQAEFAELIDGTHPLYRGIGDQCKSIIRAFLLTFRTETAKRSGHREAAALNVDELLGTEEEDRPFKFSGLSVGNAVFSGMRLYFGSLPATIWMWSRLARLPANTSVVPSVNTNVTLTIGAELEDPGLGPVWGQNAISHPTKPGAHTKAAGDTPMEARIKRIFYVNQHGERLVRAFRPYGEALRAVQEADTVVYSMGSVYTSLVPSLILRGMGDAVRASRRKVLLLNARNDRETSWLEPDGEGGVRRCEFTVVDYVCAVAGALHGHEDPASCRVADYVSDVVCAAGCPIEERRLAGPGGPQPSLAELGVALHVVAAESGPEGEQLMRIPELVQRIMTLGD